MMMTTTEQTATGSAEATKGVPPGVEGVFRLRDAFGTSLRVLGKHFVALITLAAIVLCPFYLVLLAVVVLRPEGILRYSVMVLTELPMVVICPAMAAGAMAHCVAQDLRGNPVRIGETLKILVRRFPPMIGVAGSLIPLVAVAVLLWLPVWGAVGMFSPRLGGDPRYGIALLIGFVVLGYCTFFAATPVCITEQAGIGVSLSRSRFLTKGHRWKVFGAFMPIVVVDVIASVMARTVADQIGAGAGLVGADVERLFASYIAQTVFLAFIAVEAAVFYHQLVVVKDRKSVASVFD